jgi:hypothetical protein
MMATSAQLCECSSEGISNGIQTDRPGCGQHLLQYGDSGAAHPRMCESYEWHPLLLGTAGVITEMRILLLLIYQWGPNFLL